MERKEAIEIIKKNWPDSSFTMLREALETLVPELKESEDERIRKWIIDDIRYNMNNEQLNNSEYKKKAEKAIAWLEKRGEQKISWSDEDEKMLSVIIKDLVHPCYEEIPDRIEKEIKWIKSMRNRVVSQPKQEWNEEDERNLNDVILFIKTGTYSLDKEKLIDWLKSLRPQSQWKPTKQQLLELRCVISGCSFDTPVLVELEEDLKKLMEE